MSECMDPIAFELTHIAKGLVDIGRVASSIPGEAVALMASIVGAGHHVALVKGERGMARQRALALISRGDEEGNYLVHLWSFCPGSDWQHPDQDSHAVYGMSPKLEIIVNVDGRPLKKDEFEFRKEVAAALEANLSK